MLQTIGVDSIDTLINQTVPAAIRLQKPPNIAPAMSEAEYLQHVAQLGKLNQVRKNFIGLGYFETHTPTVILGLS